jgi:hypothetical protein
MDGAGSATPDAEGEVDGSFDADGSEADDGPSASAFRVVATVPVEGSELEGADAPVRITLVDVWVARYVLGQGWQAGRRRELSASHAVRMEAPNVAIDARGRALLTWSEATTSGPDFDSAVWVARFE